MKLVTLKFPSLQLMAECIFKLSITHPVLDYDKYTLTAELNEKQIDDAIECEAQVLDVIGMK